MQTPNEEPNPNLTSDFLLDVTEEDLRRLDQSGLYKIREYKHRDDRFPDERILGVHYKGTADPAAAVVISNEDGRVYAYIPKDWVARPEVHLNFFNRLIQIAKRSNPSMESKLQETNPHLTPNLLLSGITADDVMKLKEGGKYSVDKPSGTGDERFPNEKVINVRNSDNRGILATFVISSATGEIYVWVPQNEEEKPGEYINSAITLLGINREEA
ncbi:hypothetical protein KKG51_03690 [Patescibacteria group bacterium]|nr:hypothetical protein [Patescibacteria group bacterium]